MTRSERLMMTVVALGGDAHWVRKKDAASAAHMDDSECEAITRALVAAGQLEAGPGIVKLSMWAAH